MKLMQWDLNGKEKVGQASIFDLNGTVHRYNELLFSLLKGEEHISSA